MLINSWDLDIWGRKQAILRGKMHVSSTVCQVVAEEQ